MLSDIIHNEVLQFASEIPDNICIDEYNNQNDIYGVLSFNVPTHDITTLPMFYHIMVDVSGSMSDKLCDGRTKMQLIIHTLTNILHYFAENTQNSHIQVTGFDDNIHSYIETTVVTKDNVDSLISKLSTMRPMNMTNIELALNTIAESVNNNNSISEKQRAVIFLTDGDTTVGEYNPTKLSELIPNNISFHSIALGSNHNSDIMYALGHHTPYTSSWFINELEHTGNVYGEILFNETHRILNNVIIRVNNGRIFNYSSGEFETSIYIGNLSSEMNKQYHIMSNTPSSCSISIQGIDMYTSTWLEFQAIDMTSFINSNQINTNSEEFNAHFIKKQYMRLCVQKIMADLRLCTQLSDNRPRIAMHVFDTFKLSDHEFKKQNDYNELQNNFNQRAKHIRNIIINYMDNNDLKEDSILSGLIDDLNVIINTLTKKMDLKYTVAREESQGRQRAYNTVSNMQDNVNDDLSLLDIRPPILQREPTSAYATPGRLDMMREISNNHENDYNRNLRAPSPAVVSPFCDEDSQLNEFPALNSS